MMVSQDHKSWISDNWKHVLSSFTLFHTSGKVYIWRTCNPECLVTTVKHDMGGGSVMVWAAISWNSVGPIITIHGQITVQKYVDRLANYEHPMIQTLFLDNGVFDKDNASIHRAGTIQSRFVEH
jgi:hypothetical protein